MKVKIDEKLICIPPYISTTWNQVTFLQSEEDPETHLFTLVIHLVEGKTVYVPNLDATVIDIAFAAHIKYLEKKSVQPKGESEPKTLGHFLQQLTGLSPDQLNQMPIRFGIGSAEGITGMEALQHNQAQAEAPDLPADILEKMSQMIKMMVQGDVASFPKPEPHCNCPYCQVSRSLHKDEKEEPESDLPVADEELQFRDWDIVKKGEKLYLVSNPLDPREQYSVFLGSPVGCTCGQPHCDHIKAVLYS